jgi:chromosome segregation ATPase
MGNTRSATENEQPDIWWDNKPMNPPENEAAAASPSESKTARQRRMKEELDQFKLDLARKHEKRREFIREKRREMEELREEVKRLKQENDELKANRGLTCATNDLEDIRRKNLELKVTITKLQSDLQDLSSEVVNFEKEKEDYKAHVVALKDVVSVSKTDADDERGAVDGVAREDERDRSVSGRERTDCFVARLEGGVREAAAKHPEFEDGLRGATESCREREGRNAERVG